MSLKDVALKIEYRSLIDNVAKEFYIPLLKEANEYKRAVGFFSSSSLIEISKGIIELVKNRGKIKLIASPKLSEEDIESIRKGYKKREEVISGALVRELKDPENDYQKDQLNLLANLIADGYLDIKIAVTEKNNQLGMYHEKVGIISDQEGNRVAFSGSMNESGNAFLSNYETIDVFKSWTDDFERVQRKNEAFEAMWEDNEQGIKVYRFENVTDTFLEKYKRETVDYDKYTSEKDEIPFVEQELTFFKTPEDVDYFDYQKDAMENWFRNGCCGIFNMATGTGKTYTALGCLAKLSQSLGEKIAVIISVPYIHLVEQWVEDIEAFHVQPIVAYGGKKWKKEFANAVAAYNIGVKKNFCIITTNATFVSADFQKSINALKKNYCFVVDEAHNFGAKKGRNYLPKRARYRIALSATIERYRDDEGTTILRKFFGKESIQFSLKEAIDRGFLCPYYYYPIVVYLDEEELDEYAELTEKISRLQKVQNEDHEVSKTVETLLIQRARIIAGCKAKVGQLIEHMRPFTKEHHILVYCGATKYDRDDISDASDIKQIDEVNKRLYQELGMRVRKFTASEDADTRTEIKDMFVNETIQVITAIKCLDEGVNIPAINRAFIMASSTNPKEYIQRRGRVLRKAPGKDWAEIYDFITLPRPLKNVKYLDSEQRKLDLSLVNREFERMNDFAETSRNPSACDSLKQQIMQEYKINKRVFTEE